MSTTVTPPPPAPDLPSTPVAPPSEGARAVSIVAIVLGAIVLCGTVVSAVVGTVASASVHTSTRTVAVSGIDDVDVDAAAGVVRVEFADVDEAELEVTSSWGADRWRFERDDDSLVVASPDRGGWFGWFGWGGWFGDGSGDAVLRLPADLEGVDADLSLSAGDLVADGTFGELDVTLGAGSFDIAGAAESLSADVSAGRGDIDLEDVREAELSVSAGSLDARLSGDRPGSVEVDVSAGSLQLTVPDGDYDVVSDVSAGGFDNRIGSTPGAANTIRVGVSAGDVVLRSE